jgi:uncharacterized RDD family membrane protein YckC
MEGKKPVRFPWEPEGERIVLETPELTKVEYRIAPFGTRIVAAALDRLLITCITSVLFFLSMLLLFSGWVKRPRYLFYFYALVLAFWFLLGILYFVVAEIVGEGKTWGKKRMGIRTILRTGQGITLGAALVRNIARLVDEWPLLWILPALTSGHRRLGDYLADTIVVMDGGQTWAERRGIPDLAASYRELGDKRFHFSATMAERLYPDDLNLLEHMEQRLAPSTAADRKKAERSVALKYVERLGIAEVELVEEDPARFLGEMKLFLRERFEGEAY